MTDDTGDAAVRRRSAWRLGRARASIADARGGPAPRAPGAGARPVAAWLGWRDRLRRSRWRVRLSRASDPRPAEAGARAAPAEEAILSLSAEDDAEDESLPEDYAAIADLFLDS